MGAFGAIALMLVATQAVGYMHAETVDRNVDLITNNALTSIELIGRMSVDLQREHILIDRHIYEHEPKVMARIEDQITLVRRDFEDAARRYEPLASFVGEAALWNQLRSDSAQSEQQESRALELSRRNEDTAANDTLIAAEPVLDAVTRDLTTLTTINHQMAQRAQRRVARLQGDVTLVRIVLALAIILITAVLGAIVTRTIGRSERRLREQTLALEARNRELDAFAGRVAHDVRGPLNTVKLAASMIAGQAPGSRPAEILHRAVAQMAALVNDLLQLSRAGAFTPGTVARIEPVASAIQTDLAPLVEQAGGELRVDLEPAAVRCPEGLLREVLWNLGENAVKYHRPDVPPAIELVGRAVRGRYRLRVVDNGRGMTAEESSHAFEPFFRSGRNRDVPGTGLGLAIVRRVVEASGGSIAVESRPDRGTTFTLDLPLAA